MLIITQSLQFFDKTSSFPIRAYSLSLTLSFQFSPSLGWMTATLVIGRLYSPADVLTFRFRIRPSRPGKTSVILPMDHLPRTVMLSATRTTSFTCKFRLSTCHCFLCTRDGKTSLLQHFQNESTILWTDSTLWQGFRDSLNGPCTTSGDARPRSMWLGDM